MRVGVGYSEKLVTWGAGLQATRAALEQAGRTDPCDLVLLFATARHDAEVLRDAVAGVVGENVPIVGGGAVGAISNTSFGYAGDQVILALFWLDGARCDILTESGLAGSETEAGKRFGQKLAALGITPDSQMLLFYDAIDRTQGEMRMVMATHLLVAMEDCLGFLPDLKGAGLQGDYQCTPARQWLGDRVGEHGILGAGFRRRRSHRQRHHAWMLSRHRLLHGD